MIWNPPDPYASFLLSVGGGFLAGLAVVVVEWLWRFNLDSRQRKQAIQSLSKLFKEWESAINSAQAVKGPTPGTNRPREAVQLAYHSLYRRKAHIKVSRWAKHIPEHDAEELSLLLASHENVIVGLDLEKRGVPQSLYDRFFSGARDINWLEF